VYVEFKKRKIDKSSLAKLRWRGSNYQKGYKEGKGSGRPGTKGSNKKKEGNVVGAGKKVLLSEGGGRAFLLLTEKQMTNKFESPTEGKEKHTADVKSRREEPQIERKEGREKSMLAKKRRRGVGGCGGLGFWGGGVVLVGGGGGLGGWGVVWGGCLGVFFWSVGGVVCVGGLGFGCYFGLVGGGCGGGWGVVVGLLCVWDVFGLFL